MNVIKFCEWRSPFLWCVHETGEYWLSINLSCWGAWERHLNVFLDKRALKIEKKKPQKGLCLLINLKKKTKIRLRLLMKIKSKPIKSQVKIDITYKNILILPGHIDKFLYMRVIIRYAITEVLKKHSLVGFFFSIFQTFNNVKNYSHLNIEINCSFPLSLQPSRDRKR